MGDSRKVRVGRVLLAWGSGAVQALTRGTCIVASSVEGLVVTDVIYAIMPIKMFIIIIIRSISVYYN